MPDEIKPPSSPPPEGEPKPAMDQPIAPSAGKPVSPASAQSEAKSVADKPPTAPATPPKPAAASPEGPAAKPAALAAAGHPVPPKPTGPVPTAWDSPMVAKFKRQYGSGVEPLTYLGQNYLVVDHSLIPEILQLLRDDEQFDYCVDVTAVHYPKREKQFDVVWILYSFPRNERIRVKTQIADGETLPSSVPIWPTANWLEREVFDMFGIKFDGHPDLKRILLPDGWNGHPLRKDYSILQQDNEWVQINLGIESGQ
jgi:NADH-quinone oxidoreductase subunit C